MTTGAVVLGLRRGHASNTVKYIIALLLFFKIRQTEFIVMIIKNRLPKL